MEQQQQHRTAWERQLLIRDKNRPHRSGLYPADPLQISMKCTATGISGTMVPLSAASAD